MIDNINWIGILGGTFRRRYNSQSLSVDWSLKFSRHCVAGVLGVLGILGILGILVGYSDAENNVYLRTVCLSLWQE